MDRAVVAVLVALVASAGACTGQQPSSAPSPPPPAAPAPSPSPRVLAPGVSQAPCPDARDPAHGCIYLGALADISEGPFAALGASILRGAQAFWERVDADGGVAGRFEVDLGTYVRDTRFDPDAHAAAVLEIAPDVAAVAMSFGTEPTVAALDALGDDDLLVVPSSLWSGWAFEPRALASGYSYCLEASGGLDWFQQERAPVTTVVSVHHGDLYGRDSAAGVGRWATANDVAFDPASHVLVTPRATDDGTQDDTVSRLVELAPDVVVLATGPAEAAELVAKAGVEGFEGRFLGSSPTWNPVLLESRAAEALQRSYDVVLPWQPWGGDSTAHAAMRAALGEDAPANEGFVYGWITQYPLLTLLETTLDGGEIPDRSTLRAALDGLTVDYEGAAPRRTYGTGGRPQQVVTVATPGEGTLGLEVLAEGFRGATGAARDLTEPCASPGDPPTAD